MQFGWLGFLVFTSRGIMRKEIIKFGISVFNLASVKN